MNPIQRAIEALYAGERCPRLRIDVTHEGVVCPDFVRERWKEQLIIDLDPSYPLDLAFTKVGVEADLSFGGHVSRCVFPWTAIYLVADRETGKGQVFQEHIPAALRQGPAPAPKPKAGPKLVVAGEEAAESAEEPDVETPKVVIEDVDGKGSRKRRRRRRGGDEESTPAAEAAPVEAVEAAPEEAAPEEAAPVEAAPEVETLARADSEEQASTRRAAFKVIDGG